MDDSSNMSPIELQLRCVNERLKKTMKEMEELFSNEEEKSYQQIQTLLEEQKELKEKVETLQNRLDNAEFLSSSSSLSSPSSSFSSQTEYNHGLTVHTSFHKNFDDSLISFNDDFAELQNSFQLVSEEKIELESKVDKLNQFIQSLQETVKDLQFQNVTQEEKIEELNSVNWDLYQTNQDLYKTVCRLQSENDELKRSSYKLDESQISLFDELEAVKQKELSEKENVEKEQIIPDIITAEMGQSQHEYIINGILVIRNRRCSTFMKRSLLRFLSVLSICFDYLSLGGKLDIPIVHFLTSDFFTLQSRPRIPQV
uniref:Uncharacterized protein n=1 Tax=Panagrolaimus sp. PS1159 TaxID=55785 RepID=A0AC35EXV6_9BILA